MQYQFDPASQARLCAQDLAAIGHTLQTLLAGFKKRNADMLEAIYHADADWVDAFGSKKRGSREIVTYLHGLFSDANFNEGTLVAEPEITLRVLSEDIVTVSGHLRIRSQGLLDGGAIRRTRQLFDTSRAAAR